MAYFMTYFMISFFCTNHSFILSLLWLGMHGRGQSVLRSCYYYNLFYLLQMIVLTDSAFDEDFLPTDSAFDEDFLPEPSFLRGASSNSQVKKISIIAFEDLVCFCAHYINNLNIPGSTCMLFHSYGDLT